MQRTPSPAFYYALFFLTGIATMLLSVLVPTLHPLLSDEQIGRLVATQFVGQLIGALLVSRQAGRSLFIGLALSALGSAALGLAGGISVIPLFAYGLGLGITMTATNILAGTEASPIERASRLEMLNVFWPLGAACTPLALRLAGHHAPPTAYLILAIGFALALPVLAVGRRNATTPILQEESISTSTEPAHLMRLCLLALLAVGMESGLSNWIPTFATRFLTSASAGSLFSTVFWIGALTGRTVASLLLRRIRWIVFAVATCVLTIIAIVAVAFAQTRWMLFAGAFLCAFAITPVYPVVLARCMHLRRKNLVFFSAGIGSSILPWIVGLVSLRSGSLRWGMLTPIAAALILVFVLRREGRATA
jgi:fucose permease